MGAFFFFAQNDNIIFFKTKKPVTQAQMLDMTGFF